GSSERDPLGAGETEWLPGDLHDVGVLGDRPERLVALRFNACDRGLCAQARPQIVGIAAARVPLRVDELERIDVEIDHQRGSRGSPRRRSPRMLRWISLVPPMIEFARAASNRSAHWPASTAFGSSGITSASAPSTATAVS